MIGRKGRFWGGSEKQSALELMWRQAADCLDQHNTNVSTSVGNVYFPHVSFYTGTVGIHPPLSNEAMSMDFAINPLKSVLGYHENKN